MTVGVPGRVGRMGLRWTLVIAVNVALVFVATEITGLVYYYLLSGQLFYARSVGVESAIEQRVNAPFKSEARWRLQLHPYFAFSIEPAATKPFQDGLYQNNHGFLQDAGYVKSDPGCCEFPSERRSPDEIIIGVVGGSVATGAALYAQSSQA